MNLVFSKWDKASYIISSSLNPVIHITRINSTPCPCVKKGLQLQLSNIKEHQMFFLWQHILAVAGNNTSKGTYNRNGFQLNLTMWLNMTKRDA